MFSNDGTRPTDSSLFPWWEHATISGMKVIAKRTLVRYLEGQAGRKDHRALVASVWGWYEVVRKATWANVMDLKRDFGSASIVGDRIVFNIKGNDYRLIVAVDYGYRIVFIKWMGTHSEYDRVDVRTVAYGG